MLLPNGMIGPVNRILHIAEPRVDPQEVGILNTLGPSAGDIRLVATSGLGKPCKRRQPIRHDGASRSQVIFRPSTNVLLAKPLDSGQSDTQGTTVLRTLDSRQKGGLPGGSLTSLSAPALPDPVGIIDLDETLQKAFIVPLLHDL